MILSDREARGAIRAGVIGVTPCPPDDSNRWSATTLDLTLDAEIRPWKEIEGVGEDPVIDPMRKGFDCNALIARHTGPEDCTNGFILEPRRLVLGWTVEKIKLPHTAKIGARVEGKSALARIGVGIHVTAPTVHPGFGYKPTQPRYPGSPLRLEIWNIGPLRVRLTKGMPICQLIFEEVHGIPEAAYKGQFVEQGPPGAPPRKRGGAGKAKGKGG